MERVSKGDNVERKVAGRERGQGGKRVGKQKGTMREGREREGE